MTLEVFQKVRGFRVEGTVARQPRISDQALLMFVDGSGEHWFPFSKIIGEPEFLDPDRDTEAVDYGLGARDLEEGDEVALHIPFWLARREGLLDD